MTLTTHTTMAEQIAGEFLQSVVLVDDEAEFASWHSAEDDAVDPNAMNPRRSRKPALKPPGPHANRLDARLVADGFAEKGIVCAILQPRRDEEEEVTARTLTVARRADVLVLDWDFYGDNGRDALELLLAVLQHDKRDHRSRLIAIYTAAPSLRAIAAQVHDKLRSVYGRRAATRKGAFRVDTAVGRVVVYAKPDTGMRVTMRESRRRVVAYERLPEIIVREFAEWTQGLVSNTALKAVAAVRTNTHQLLRKLSPELDPGYLWHRALQSDPADAEEHLVSIIASEFRSILDDTDVRSAAGLPAIREWLGRRPLDDYAPRFDAPSHRSAADLLDLLEFGTAGDTEESKRLIQRFSSLRADKAHKKSIAAFATSAPAALRANEEFAALTSLRTQYRRPLPRLALGTIISRGRGANRRYWVCLQPRCDSVRIHGGVPFPMLPLEPALDAAFQVLLPGNGRRRSIRLALKAKPRRLEMIQFSALSPTGCVTADVGNRGFTFVDSKRNVYRWEGELKFEPAQRVAEILAREFSRVGLTESEWLRLWSK